MKPRTLTNAPERYDWSYTTTVRDATAEEVAAVTCNPRTSPEGWRVVEHDTEANAEIQRARYGSGLYYASKVFPEPNALETLADAVRVLVRNVERDPEDHDGNLFALAQDVPDPHRLDVLLDHVRAMAEYLATVPDDETPGFGTLLCLAGDVEQAWREGER